MAPETDVPAILQEVSRDFAKQFRLQLKYVTATWRYFQPEHYMVGAESATQQPGRELPLLVELVVPDFYEYTRLTKMMHYLAERLAYYSDISAQNIFIETRMAQNGYVFDRGQILQW